MILLLLALRWRRGRFLGGRRCGRAGCIVGLGRPFLRSLVVMGVGSVEGWRRWVLERVVGVEVGELFGVSRSGVEAGVTSFRRLEGVSRVPSHYFCI